MNSNIMKVKYLMLSLLVGAMALTSVNAQETTAPENQLPAYKQAFTPSAGHWFIEAQVGTTVQFLGQNEKVSLLNRIKDKMPLNLMPALSIGKWHNPYFATRLQLMSGLTPVYGMDQKAIDVLTIGAHFDFMFDLVNYFASYNPKRVFHMTPFVGVGYQFKSHGFYKLEKPYRNSATANAGLQFAFRLAKRADLVLEAQAIYHNINFLCRDIHYGKDFPNFYGDPKVFGGLMGMATAGFRFNLGETDWEVVTPMDEEMIKGLNDEISSLRAENAELSKRPVSCPECPEVKPVEKVEVVGILTPRAILFGFDKAKIAPKQEYKLTEIADFVKETNTPIVIVGYSDKTGNAKYNLGLSERRAKAVADALVNQYGVASDMISVEWEGETDQYGATKAWNRAVIVRSK